MTASENATKLLDYYLDLEGDPEFAVLLEGPWGSGKSHFVAKYFRDRHARMKKVNAEAKDPLIHVTLFGVRDLSDITTQMFEKAHPVLGGTAMKIAHNALSSVAGFLGASLDAKENAALLQSVTLNLKGRILVFDDLERSPLPLVDVMGFINRFVEQDMLKVIVIANEGDIPEDQKEEYKRRKEKLIGKTVKVETDAGEVLDIFAKRLKMPEVHKALAANREPLLATFAASEKPNYRSLRAALLDFERIVDQVDTRLRANDDAMGKLLLNMVALGLEFRSNTIDDAGLRRLNEDLILRVMFGTSLKAPSKEQERASMLQERYDLVAFGDPIIRYDHLADIFTSGMVDVTEANRHIAQHPTIVGHRQVPAWRLMWGWYDLGMADYADARKRFLDDLNGRKITHPGQILHVAGTSIRLRKYDDDLLEGVDAEAYFTAYLADLEQHGTLEPAPDLFGFNGGSYAGLVYNENETTEFRALETLVKAAASRALDNAMKAHAAELLNNLRADPGAVDVLHEWGLSKGNFGGIAILNHIPEKEFADVALIDGKLNDRLLSAIRERHRQGYGAALDAEVPWLTKLRDELGALATSLAPPHRNYVERRLDQWFKDLQEGIAASSRAG